MRSQIIFGIFCLTLGVQAHAAPLFSFHQGPDGVRQLRPLASTPSPAQGDQGYDNWTSPENPDRRGVTSLRERYRVGADEFADDVFLADWQPGIVSDVGWTYYNFSDTRAITSFRATLRFYDGNLNLVAIDSAIYSGQSLPPGVGARISSNGGFYQEFDIPVSAHMFISLQFSEMANFDVHDVGVRYGGPITAGDSTQFIRNLTTGEQIDLGATPQANLGFFIDTIPLPGPTPLAVLGFSLLAHARRRRR